VHTDAFGDAEHAVSVKKKPQAFHAHGLLTQTRNTQLGVYRRHYVHTDAFGGEEHAVRREAQVLKFVDLMFKNALMSLKKGLWGRIIHPYRINAVKTVSFARLAAGLIKSSDYNTKLRLARGYLFLRH